MSRLSPLDLTDDVAHVAMAWLAPDRAVELARNLVAGLHEVEHVAAQRGTPLVVEARRWALRAISHRARHFDLPVRERGAQQRAARAIGAALAGGAS